VACAVAAGPVSAIAFDRDHARAAGRRVVAWEAGMALGLLGLVALVTPACGAPFVFAYLTLPAAAAERDVARPLAVVAFAAALGTLGFLVGATASIAWDLPFATSAVAGVLVVDGFAFAGSYALRLLRALAPRDREGDPPIRLA
jgi:ABC-type Mn2+/Zn2+ transport system permease subunit